MRHGSIFGAVVAVPHVEAALADYRDRLGLRLVADAPLGAELAAAWGCPANADSRTATLQPSSGAPCFVRLVEQPLPQEFAPTMTYGWASYELTVADVFDWPARLAGSGFRVVGEPKEIPGLPYFVAMQVHGPGREMLYLNETRGNTPTSDLPIAKSPVDHIFIVVLAAPDRAASVAWYRHALDLDESETHVIPYTMINRAFGLSADTTTALTMVQNGRMPIVEVDEYPAQAGDRARDPGRLPPGNSLVSLAVQNLDTCRCEWIAPPIHRQAPPYAGRRSATTIGKAGELLELVEFG